MKAPLILTAAALAALSLAACDRNQAAPEDEMTADAMATDAATDAPGSTGDGMASSASDAGSDASGMAASDSMSASGESMSSGAQPAPTTMQPGVASVQQEKAENREMLSPGGASSGPTAPPPKN